MATGPLKNGKHELFAQGLAKGMNQSEAAALAGLAFAPFDFPQGSYVYLLVDPRTDQVFYVGKGTGSRALHHERQARRGTGPNELKREIINAILAAGLKPQILIVADGLSSREALRLERSLIVKAHRVLSNHALGDVDALDRVAQTARASLSQIKPLCQMMAEGASPERMAVWQRVVGGLSWIVQRAA